MEFEKVREEDVLKLLEERKFADVRDLLKDMEPIDIAELLEEMPEEKLPLLFRILPKEMAADTFVEMDSDMQEYLIQTFSDKELKEVREDMYLDRYGRYDRGDARQCGAENPEAYLSGDAHQDQRNPSVSEGLRRKHDDNGVCGSPERYDRAGCFYTNPAYRCG